MLNSYYQFMDKADAWTEREGWIDWIIAYPLQIIIGLLLIAGLLILLVNWSENKTKGER